MRYAGLHTVVSLGSAGATCACIRAFPYATLPTCASCHSLELWGETWTMPNRRQLECAMVAAILTAACSTPQLPGATPTASAPGEAAAPALAIYGENSGRVVNIVSSAVLGTVIGPSQVPQGTGSGFVYDSLGHIVTNDHVIDDGLQLEVNFANRTSQPATIVRRDPDTDLAILQIQPPPGVEPVRLGDSDKLRIGQVAVAIGSPLGLRQTVTQGIVSALRAPGEESATGPIGLLGGAVQTDAP